MGGHTLKQGGVQDNEFTRMDGDDMVGETLYSERQIDRQIVRERESDFE